MHPRKVGIIGFKVYIALERGTFVLGMVLEGFPILRGFNYVKTVLSE
jgi:hypothetical protein